MERPYVKLFIPRLELATLTEQIGAHSSNDQLGLVLLLEYQYYIKTESGLFRQLAVLELEADPLVEAQVIVEVDIGRLHHSFLKEQVAPMVQIAVHPYLEWCQMSVVGTH